MLFRLIETFDARVWWIIGELVRGEGNAFKRAERITKCVELAEACLRLNNFSALFEIISALEHPYVTKLRHAWTRVSTEVKKRFEKLIPISRSVDNYLMYRQELAKCRGKARLPASNVVLKVRINLVELIYSLLFSISSSQSQSLIICTNTLQTHQFRTHLINPPPSLLLLPLLL